MTLSLVRMRFSAAANSGSVATTSTYAQLYNDQFYQNAAGNVTYKAVQRSAGVVAMGPLLQGLNRPVNDLSRGCLVEDIVFTIALTAIDACKAQGYNVSVHVLGREGQVVVAMRNPAAGLATFENSMKKAYTARTLRMPSGRFAENVKGNPNAAQFFLTNFVAAQGALPITVGNDVIGAVGISGAPGGDKDEACAKAGIDKVAADLR